MTTLNRVDPESFINLTAKTPRNGRGTWTRTGIDFAAVYMLAPEGQKRIGAVAEKSLDHWATAAGVLAIQNELAAQGFNPGDRDGVFGPDTDAAVRAFQTARKLYVDGEFGRKSAVALFTPVIDAHEDVFNIPNRLLRGLIAGESALDPGAVGYYIYYGETLSYRGVDRGAGQINSKAHADITWLEAFDFSYGVRYTADRLRDTFDALKKSYPKATTAVLWDAAVCSHNNPSAGRLWAKNGVPPTDAAALYVSKIKNAIY